MAWFFTLTQYCYMLIGLLFANPEVERVLFDARLAQQAQGLRLTFHENVKG